MHDRDLYEYAVIRYVPDIEREEFVNVGLVMMCKRRRWMRVDIVVDCKRIGCISSINSHDEIARQLSTFTSISAGEKHAGPIAALPVEERFRWLTAVKSCCIQTSRPHPGFSDNLEHTFERLMNRLVR